MALHDLDAARRWDIDDLPDGAHPRALREDPRIGRIAGHFRGIMAALGLDLDDPNLVGTDQRVARMYVEIFAGLDEDAEPRMTTFPNDEGYNQMVVVKDIPFYSMCAHHFLPFFGRAHVGYVPDGRVVGLSK